MTHIPSQQCPYCNQVISVKPVNDSGLAFDAAMNSMCAKFEKHMRQQHDIVTEQPAFAAPAEM